jgi:hypothetical protein
MQQTDMQSPTVPRNFICENHSRQGDIAADFVTGCLLMHNQQYVDALLYWQHIASTAPVSAVCYNSALCCFFAKDFLQAKTQIELCIRNIQTPHSPLNRNATINHLLAIEAQSDNYLRPLIPASLDLCPELALLRANRLLYDICLRLEDTQTAQRIARTLEHKHFSNIK